MKVVRVENGNTPVEGDFDVLVSELPLTYLQGVRDAEGVDAILIGSNGSEIQLSKNKTPSYTEYKSVDEALKGLGYEL